MNNYESSVTEILTEISQTMATIKEEEILEFIEMIKEAEQIFFVGVGRVRLSLEAIAKRLAHLGFQTHVVGEVTEPAITEKDLLIVGSGSGESIFPLGVACKAKEFKAKVAHIGSAPQSSMTQYSNHFIRIPVNNKVESTGIVSNQPMTSLFEQTLLLLGDTIALMLIQDNHLDMKTLWQYHANLE